MQLINSNDGHKNIYEILSTYIQIKSESGDEKEAGLFLRNLCEANQLNISPWEKPIVISILQLPFSH